ncbi:MAG: nucleotide exchange factor GrpE [Ignavibacteriales bacterium]|nr:nucleotide exchange factor GrpE [Ignavibacteriales bacterium]
MEIEIKDNHKTLLPPADWEGEIERLQEALRVERDQNLRSLADYTNYRRRIERDISKLAMESNREVFLPLLSIVDDLEKALQYMDDVKQPFVNGIVNIYKKIIALLEVHGVVQFVSAGAVFDHNIHEAIAMRSDTENTPGTVVDVVRTGYLWNNELLRAAQVSVAE